jgi:hypothetical protein
MEPTFGSDIAERPGVMQRSCGRVSRTISSSVISAPDAAMMSSKTVMSIGTTDFGGGLDVLALPLLLLFGVDFGAALFVAMLLLLLLLLLPPLVVLLLPVFAFEVVVVFAVLAPLPVFAFVVVVFAVLPLLPVFAFGAVTVFGVPVVLPVVLPAVLLVEVLLPTL